MAREPLSKLRPPDSAQVGDNTCAAGAGGDVVDISTKAHSRLEWTVTDLNLLTSPHMETFLPGVWKRMHDDGTFQMFFHEAQGEMTFGQFATALSLPDERLQIVMGHNVQNGTWEHAGFVLLNHILFSEKVKRATGNFCFFREYWNRHDTSDMARAVLDNWFGVLDADCITGITPRQNRPAIAFVKRIGFTIVGDVPMFTTYEGEPSAAAVSYMLRDQWRKRYHPDAPTVPDSPKE